jgi:carboxyl-terminal processing protease
MPDSLKAYTLIEKRTVYGGGGIMPDIFIPVDTSNYSDYYRDIIRKGIINKFSLDYMDKNREQLKKNYPNFKIYNKNFVVDDSIFNQLVILAEKEGIKKNENQIATSRKEINTIFKAYIARDLWESTEFYEVFNEDQPLLKKAVEVMRNYDSYKKQLNKK